MSQSDKLLRLRGNTGATGERYTMTGYLQTTGNTTTTIITIEVPEKSVVHLWIQGVGAQDDFSDHLSVIEGTSWYRASGGNVTDFGTGGSTWEDEDSASAPTTSIGTSASTLLVQVTGVAAETWNWFMTADVCILTIP